MGLFKQKQDCEQVLRKALSALFADDGDQFSKLAGKLSKYTPKELISAIGTYGFDMRQAGVGDELITSVVTGMAPDDEPSKSAFLSFCTGAFSGVPSAVGVAAKELQVAPGLSQKERGDLLLLAIVTAGRIAQRHDLPI